MGTAEIFRGLICLRINPIGLKCYCKKAEEKFGHLIPSLR
jgi:hypothetical protein